jgi:rod shape-determining protein MreB
MTWKQFWPGKGHHLYIDLGTANTIVVDRHRGLVANEPSIISYRESAGKRVVVSVGSTARTNLGKTPENFMTCFPLREGVIANLETTEAMLRYFLHKGQVLARFIRPNTIISLPHGVSAVERKAVSEAGIAAGARDVVLIEEPILAAIGSNLPVHAPRGNMVIDIGAGTTEIAVISLNDIVHCESIRIGGNTFDQSIIEHIRSRYNLIIGEATAERAKKEIGCVIPEKVPSSTCVRGMDFSANLPKEMIVQSNDLFFALNGHIVQIIEAARRTLEAVPPELVPDIAEHGIYVAGGGALLKGLKERLQMELGIPVHISQNPLLSVARGGELVLKSEALFHGIRMAMMN